MKEDNDDNNGFMLDFGEDIDIVEVQEKKEFKPVKQPKKNLHLKYESIEAPIVAEVKAQPKIEEPEAKEKSKRELKLERKQEKIEKQQELAKQKKEKRK